MISEGRPEPATRTRLRGGTLLDLDRSALSGCTLYDVDDGNVGIILPDPECDLPDMILIRDDRDLTVTLSQVRWRLGPHLVADYRDVAVPVSIALAES
jgi:hypothetical protein